jgi:membrane protein implicated in regulation of membrane protease activity
MEVLWWHWIVLGFLLMAAEIFVPSFTIFWAGLAALVVGGLAALFSGFTLPGQIALWAALSALLVGGWFAWINPRLRDRTTAGMAKEAISGKSGLVVEANAEGTRGKVRFVVPIMGADEWPFLCEEGGVRQGDRVVAYDHSGNTLMVRKG